MLICPEKCSVPGLSLLVLDLQEIALCPEENYLGKTQPCLPVTLLNILFQASSTRNVEALCKSTLHACPCSPAHTNRSSSKWEKCSAEADLVCLTAGTPRSPPHFPALTASLSVMGKRQHRPQGLLHPTDGLLQHVSPVPVPPKSPRL